MDDYEKQAQDFLTATNSTLEIKLSEFQNAPLWAKEGEKHGYKYAVTLSNARGSYTFPFWDSIANAEKMDALKLIKDARYGDHRSPEYYRAHDLLKKELGKRVPMFMKQEQFDEYAKKLAPTAYSVLACLDQLYSDSFEDFCAEYGYDTDSRTAERTYNEMLEQDRQLRRLFTLDELEQLAEIA